MKYINSPQNPVFKNLKALATSSKFRREQSQTIIEGIHLAASYLQSGKLPVTCVVSQLAIDNKEVAEIISTCETSEVNILAVSDQQFRAISSVENGVGLLFVVTIPKADAVPVLNASALLLDGVQDPGNVGAILRVAAAAGAENVYCSPETAAIWSPKVLRAGMGAHFVLNIYENVSLTDVIAAAEIPVYATTLQAKQSIYDVSLNQPVAWIVGNEGQGVSAELLKLSVEQVIIPQNFDVESLNVATATAVCLFEQRRQSLAMGK